MSFRWKYIALPVTILLLSIILAVCFYRLLPADIAYHFGDGSPDNWVNRGAFLAWILTPQLFFVLLAAGIVWGIVKLSAHSPQARNTQTKLDILLSLMGNMVALPQLILSFAMLNIFSYNAYQRDIMPLWLFAVIIMVLGGFALAVFFFRAILQIRKPSSAGFQGDSKEK